MICALLLTPQAFAQQTEPPKPASSDPDAAGDAPPSPVVFDLGQITVVGTPVGQPGVGGSVLSSEQIWNYDRNSLEKAVNVIPGVVSNFDENGRRNETDILVRGFGRWQVPLMIDGVRIYLPADNRLDFARFLTADVAEIQIQKGYASVIDGPGAMGGAINLVTRKPTKPFEAEGSIWTGGRTSADGWNGYAMIGTRQPKFYAQGSANYSKTDFWTLSGNYVPPPRSLQPAGERLSSDSSDSRYNLKAGPTPNTDEYTINYIKQLGEKGAPLNIYNNPPSPPNSYWHNHKNNRSPPPIRSMPSPSRTTGAGFSRVRYEGEPGVS
jgi:iron complex outermembrane receptor protein